MKAQFYFILLLLVQSAHAQTTLRVGAKHFNEGYILSEMIALILEEGGYKVERKFNLGGTTVSFEALRTGAIDVYPEYTGTIAKEILKSERTLYIDEINNTLRALYQLEISKSYGFSNSYALLMSNELKDKLGITNISQLKDQPELKMGLSYEFTEREDGWRNLSKVYALPQSAIALEHGLAYQALRENKIEVTDAYSTDGEIKHFGFSILEDDKNFFPDYEAVSFYAATFPSDAKSLLDKLTSSISEKEMQQLNEQALYEKKSHREIAQQFLTEKGILKVSAKTSLPSGSTIAEKTLQHLMLTFLALLAATLVALPLGISIFENKMLSKIILYITGIFQTVPSIALLALLIPLFGIGAVPAIIALFFYALLPILRNTVIGLSTVDPILKKVAMAIGIPPRKSLFLIQIPLAMPMILAGIRTAAVISVGTATLAAFIGAGGLGEFIVTGLALNNTNLILMGAIPAAVLAITTELLFEFAERQIIPRHLQKM